MTDFFAFMTCKGYINKSDMFFLIKRNRSEVEQQSLFYFEVQSMQLLRVQISLVRFQKIALAVMNVS